MTLSVPKPNGLTRMPGGRSDAYRVVRKDKEVTAQIELVRNTLVEYGLSENEATVYLYLARTGEKKASEVAEAVSLHRTEAYQILYDLERAGIVIETFETPLKFTAVPLERAVAQLVEAQRMKVKFLEKKESELIQLWSSMSKPLIEATKKEVFQILTGDAQIVLKARELLVKTESEVRVFVPDNSLALLYNSDFLEDLEQRSFNVIVSLLTEDSLKSRLICERLGWVTQDYCVGDVEGLPCFMVMDRSTLLAMYRKKTEEKGQRTKKMKTVGLWTNCRFLVDSMLALFYRLGKQPREMGNV